jgi:hypothetical protein
MDKNVGSISRLAGLSAIGRCALIAAMLVLAGCASAPNFSQSNAKARDFHPKKIAILPATVGDYEAARDIVENAIAKDLSKRGWFENVVDVSAIKTQAASSDGVGNDLSTFIQKVNTLGMADKTLSGRLRDTLGADALFLTYVTSWGYGRLEGNKVGRVGLSVKLVDPTTGTIMWKASYEEIKSYWMFKPKLDDMAASVLDVLLKDMPH